ncbi:MAG: hypothetical protein HQ519_09625 [Planctomycetes bacterium]|nr:hypothetical protein [Planctomycetota bacterium]
MSNFLRTLFFVWALVPPSFAYVQEEVPQDPVQEPAKIKLQLVDTDIRDALRMVSQQGGMNMIVSNEVKGNITLDLTDATLMETLTAIVGMGGYQYSIDGNMITVTSLQEILDRDKLRDEMNPKPVVEQEVLVIELRYVDAERMLSVIEKLLSKTGTATLLKTADHIAKDYANQSSQQSQSSNIQQEDGLRIGGQLTSSTQGTPAKSHTLVAVDTPDRLDSIRRVVTQIDVKPVQVIIEARFVEVSLDNTHKLGIDWNLVASANGGIAPHTFPFGSTSFGSYGPGAEGVDPGSLFPSAPNSVTSGGEDGLFTFGALDFSSLTAVLDLMESDQRVQIVSNPRVVVGDRHTATILVGERYPILSANVSEYGSVTEQLERYEPIGVQLEVTPSVLGDDEVELLVRPSTSSLGASVTGSTGLTVARINSRQIDTSVTVRDRQTVVLGGLFTTREQENNSKVPFLSRIPIFGNLFEHEGKTVERVDLVVFLTVTIVQEHGLTNEQRAMFEESGGTLEERITTPIERSSLEYSSTGPQR